MSRERLRANAGGMTALVRPVRKEADTDSDRKQSQIQREKVLTKVTSAAAGARRLQSK